MKLIQAVSTYQLLELIVYRSKYIDEDENVILIIPEWINAKIVNFKMLESIFGNIINFNYSPNYNSSNVTEEILNYYDRFLEKNKIELDKLDEIHVAGAHYGIGNYLCLKEYNFILWEEASGVISQPDILRDIERNLSISRLKFNDNLGIIDGSSRYIYKIFANLKTQKDLSCDKIKHFDVVDELRNMSTEKRENIISIFSAVPKIMIPKDSVLLLTEHFANCKRLSFEEQILIYQLYFDYFLTGEIVVIKPHPDDLMYYDQLFPDVTVIRDKFPSEFMEYIFDNKPKALATISSASVKALRESFLENLILDNRFEKQFRIIHKYYCGLEIATQMCDYSQIDRIGMYDVLFDNLYSKNFNKREAVKSFTDFRMYIVDDYDDQITNLEIVNRLLKCGENECFLFLNSKENYLFFDAYKPEIWKYILPICIKKERGNDNTLDFYCDTNDEMMYLYTRNPMVRRRVNEMSFEKTLNNTGVTIEKEIQDDKNLEVEILKGKLRATEKRLKYYIELVESMEKGK